MANGRPASGRQQIMLAGIAEFAAYGIAGARVDRIAKLAGCSPGLVYRYFAGKEDLFNAVLTGILEAAEREVPITPGDLPAYAGRLFDLFDQRPEIARVICWYQLERATLGRRIDAATQATVTKIEAVRRAQKSGALPDCFAPQHFVLLIAAVASMWATQPAEITNVSDNDAESRRSTVVEAVRRLAQA